MGNKSIQIDKNNSSLLVKLITIVIFVTNISQLPFLVENNSTRYLSNIGWIIVAIFVVLQNKVKLRKFEVTIISMGLLFLLGILLSELLTSHNHFKSNLINSFYLAIFILLIGSFVSKLFDIEAIKLIMSSYITSVFIVSLFLFVNVFKGGFNWFSIGYVYGSKNSISQMILTAMILVFFYYPYKIKFEKIIRLSLLVFWLILLLALKSRATIIFLLVIPLYIIIDLKISIRLKTGILLLIMCIGIAFMINPLWYSIVVDGVLLGGRRGFTINEISSNRLTHITVYFPMWFKGNELLGTGTYFVESLPFNAILKHGILFGWIPILISVWPTFWALRKLDKKNSLHLAFIFIALSYLVNSLFEGLAPFGPGAKTYFLWLMFGILYSNKKLLPTKYVKKDNMDA